MVNNSYYKDSKDNSFIKDSRIVFCRSFSLLEGFYFIKDIDDTCAHP